MEFHCHIGQFAAGRAPIGGEFALPPVRMYPPQRIPPLTKNPQQNKCQSNVQPLVPGKFANGNPNRITV
jgi:hypothetical protein